MVDALIGLIGVVLGWYLNVQSTTQKEKENLFMKKCNSLKESQYIIRSQLNILNQLQKHIDSGLQSDSKIEYWQKIRIYYHTFKLIDLRREFLFFLTTDNRELLDTILMADAGYQAILNMLDKRNKLYEKYEEKTESVPEENIESIHYILGDRLYEKLHSTTGYLVEKNKETIEDHTSALKSIDEYLKSLGKEVSN